MDRKNGGILIGVLLAGLVGWWLPWQPAVEPGMDAGQVRVGLALLVAVAWLWLTESLPISVTALLIPVVCAMTGVMPVKDGLSSFADPLIFLFLGGFALAAALHGQGLDMWLVKGLLKRVKGSFHTSCLALFALTAFLSLWVSNTATAAVMLPLAIGILARIKEKAGDAAAARAAPYIMLGIAYSASIGGMGSIVGTPPNGIGARALGIGFADWFSYGLPVALLLLPLMWLALRLMVPTGDIPPVEIPEGHQEFGRSQWLTLGIFAVMALSWTAGKPLGEKMGITAQWDTVVALSGLILLVVFRVVKWAEIESRTDWGVLLLFGGGLCLSVALEKTGASAFLSGKVIGLTQTWSPLLMILAVAFFVIFLGELASNTAVAALLVPLFLGVAEGLGLPQRQLVLVVTFAASCGFMLPVATPPNALVFGTRMVPQRDMIRAGFVLNIFGAILITLLSFVVF